MLEAVPADACVALDVGTGNGLLAADLYEKVAQVVAIDLDEAVLTGAGTEFDGIEWIHGDVMDHPFGRTFDVVASVAMLHHVPDVPAALRRLAALTSPGGVLVVIGLARSTRVAEFGLDLVGLVQHRWFSWRKGYWEHSAPTVWPPPHSYTEIRDCAMRELPGVQWKRLPLFRYALIWHNTSD